MLTYDTQSRAISQACIHNSYKIFMFLRTPSHISNPSSQGKGFSFRRPDSLVESGLGLLLPHCRTEHHNPSYEGDLLPPHLIHVREKRSRHHELFCAAVWSAKRLRHRQLFCAAIRYSSFSSTTTADCSAVPLIAMITKTLIQCAISQPSPGRGLRISESLLLFINRIRELHPGRLS